VIEVMAFSLTSRLTSPLRSTRHHWQHFAESTHTLARQAMSRFRVFDLTAHASRARCANGRAIYVNPQDGRGRSLVLRGGDVNLASLVMSLLAERPWTNVIDVGANYGEMLLGVELPRAAIVIALEPNPYVIPYLSRTLQESGVGVELISKAASARSGTTTLAVDRNWSGLSGIAGAHAESAGHAIEFVEVPTVTLATLIKERNADVRAVRLLVKIDVEMHEVAVLQGFEDMLAGFEEFAALVEIVHLTAADIEWLLPRFDFALLDTESNKLTKIDLATPAELQKVLAGTKFYRQDAVLRRRSVSVGAPG
jgi:FkbM family methyltransferase